MEQRPVTLMIADEPVGAESRPRRARVTIAAPSLTGNQCHASELQIILMTFLRWMLGFACIDGYPTAKLACS